MNHLKLLTNRMVKDFPHRMQFIQTYIYRREQYIIMNQVKYPTITIERTNFLSKGRYENQTKPTWANEARSPHLLRVDAHNKMFIQWIGSQY